MTSTYYNLKSTSKSEAKQKKVLGKALEKVKKLLFVALPYATSELHLGRIIGTFLPADVYKRYCSIFKNTKPIILSGLDCFGTSVYLEALKKKKTPAKLVEEKEVLFNQALNQLRINLRFNFKTNSKAHKRFVRKSIEQLFLAKKVYKKMVSSNYCENCKTFLADRLVIDQSNIDLEKRAEASEKTKGKLRCIFCLGDTIKKETLSLFLKYTRSDLVQKEKEISRDFLKWGVPCSKLVQELLEKKVSYYVWIDALYSYLEQYKRVQKNYFYKSPTFECSFFYAKDNRYYHEIVYPELLLDLNFKNAPTNWANRIFCRNYLNFGTQKMSSSKGNLLTIRDFKNFDPDLLRFGLARFDTLRKDTSVTKEKLVLEISLFFRKYFNLINRFIGLNVKKVKISRTTFLKDFYLLYEHFMDKNDLRKALLILDQIQRKLNQLIQKDLLAAKSVLFINKVGPLIIGLLKMLEPFIPVIAKKLIKAVRKSESLKKKDFINQ